MPETKNAPTVSIGRGTHHLPAVAVSRRAAAEAALQIAERDQAVAAVAERDQKILALENALHAADVARVCVTSPNAKTEADREKLSAAVEAKRKEWFAAGAEGVFDAFAAVRTAEHELGLVAVPPSPKGRTVAAALAASSPEAAAAARRADAAYRQRLRELGLELPGNGSAGAHSRPF